RQTAYDDGGDIEADGARSDPMSSRGGIFRGIALLSAQASGVAEVAGQDYGVATPACTRSSRTACGVRVTAKAGHRVTSTVQR
ncbi:MAG: hypothetical protein J2P53_12890, partial [Bradyrhizobiaceae bacterium]|nr:hypothetical protein [Bradyrhizobiaceae bacterium]